MGFLTDTVEKAGRKARRRGHVPDWMALAPVAGGVAIAVVVAVSMLLPSGSSGPAQIVGPGGILVTPGTGTTATVPTAATVPTGGGSTAVPATTAPAARLESVEKTDGTRVDLDADAVTTAKAAAIATWTGRWDGVAVLGEPGAAPTAYPNASLTRIRVLGISPDNISFVAEVDLNADAVADTTMQVTVQRHDGTWVFPIVGA